VLTWNQIQFLFDGARITVQVFVLAAVLGTVLSLVFGIMSLSESRLLRGFSRVYVEVARGASAIVLLFWVAFALPILLGIPQVLTPLPAAVIALGLNMGGYGAEVVRGGIQSIPRGQTEASIALNLTSRDRLRHVILPQAILVMLPPYGNLNIEVMKGTSLVALIALADLTFKAQSLRVGRVRLENPPSTAVIFGTALVVYFVLSQLIAVFYRWAEGRAGGRWYKVRR
jgi:polar amino acid transport system permease protein